MFILWRFCVILSFVVPFGAHAQSGQNALHQAILSNNLSGIKTAIAAKQNLEVRDSEGRTPLMLAVYQNQIEAAKALISAGANVNAADKIANSPFLYAGAEGKNEILEALLQSGRVDFKQVNRYGGTALIPAAEKGHVQTVERLLRTEIAIDHINNLGWSALLEAIILSKNAAAQEAIVEKLLKAGANPNLADGKGVTPLAHAKMQKLAKVIRLLEESGAR